MNDSKLCPHIVLKRKTMPIEKLPKGAVVRCYDNGWMGEYLEIDWLKTVRQPSR